MATPDAYLNVGLTFDEHQSARAMDRHLRNLERRIKSSSTALGSITSYTTDFKQFEKSIDAATARVAAFGLTAGIFLSVKRGIQALLNDMIEVEKAFTDINVVLGLSNSNLEKFGREVFRIAKETGQSFKVAAEAALELSRQGLGAAETNKRLRDSLILSRLAGMDAKSAVESLTTAINSFSDSILDSTQIVNKFAKVDAMFAVSSKDFAEAIKRVGSTAQDAGVDIDELIGIVTALQQATGRGGSVIGNTLKTLFTRPERSSLLRELEDMGVTVRDINQQFLETDEILKNVAQSLGDMSRADRSTIVEQLGGIYQINQLRTILKDFRKNQGSVSSIATAASRTAENEAILRNVELNRTIAAQLNRAAVNFKQASADIGKIGFGGNIKFLIDVLNESLEIFNKRDSESLGGQFAEGFIRGMGDFIIGPGGLFIGILLGRTLFRSLKDLSQIAKGMGDLTRTIAGTNSQLANQEAIMQRMALETQRRLIGEQQILGTITAQNMARSGIAGSATGSILRAGMTPHSVGVAPNLNPNIVPPGAVGSKASMIAAAGLRRSPVSLTKDLDLKIKEAHAAVVAANLIDNQNKYGGFNPVLPAGFYLGKSPHQTLAELQALRSSEQAALAARVRGLETSNVSALKTNMISGAGLRRAAASGPVTTGSEQMIMEESMQMGQHFAALALRDRQDAIRNRNQLRRFATVASLESGASKILGIRERAILERMAQGGNPFARSALDRSVLNARTRLQNVGFGVSFLGETAFGTIGGTIDTSTRGGRIRRAATEGFGTTLGTMGMGAAVTGGNPIGAAIGAAIGGLIALTNVLKEMGTVLPEVTRAAEMARDEFSRTQDKIQQISKLGELVAGLRSGDIKPTKANLENFANMYSAALSGLSGSNQLRADAAIFAQNNAEAISDFSKFFSEGPTKRQDFTKFSSGIQALAQGTLPPEALFDIMAQVPTKKGIPLSEFLGGSMARRRLGQVQLPGTAVSLSGDVTPIEANVDAFVDMFRDLGITDQAGADLLRSSFMESFKKNPKETIEFFQSILSRPTGGLREQGLSRVRGEVGESVDIPDFNRVLAISSLASQLQTQGTGLETSGMLSLSRGQNRLSIMEAEHRARLARAGMSMSPSRIERLRGMLGAEGIGAQYNLALESSRRQTGGQLSTVLKQLTEGVPQTTDAATTKNILAQIGVLSGIIPDIAEGKAGATDAFKAGLGALQGTISKRPNVAAALSETMNNLNSILTQSAAKETELIEGKDANLKVNQINTKLAEELATPQSRAAFALRQLRDSIEENRVVFRKLRDSGLDVVSQLDEYDMALERDRAFRSAFRSSGRFTREVLRGADDAFEDEEMRFNALRGAGLLDNNEIAAGNLSLNRQRILRGGLSGRQVVGMAGETFSDQMTFTVNDAYLNILEATQDFAVTLKSSFKDIFTNIILQGQGFGEAMRNFGLALASKALERSVDFSANALFGGLQALGGASLSYFKNNGKNRGGFIRRFARGGLVSGGSGVKDDLPMMLSEGDFVVRKSSVNKYGVGMLNALNFANGGVAIRSSNLSNFALTDENNPQNRLRMEREANELNAYIQYRQALRAFKNQQAQSRYAALISAGTGIAGAGLSAAFRPSMAPGTVTPISPSMIPGNSITAPANFSTSMTGAFRTASGGLMTLGGVRRYAGGGSVDNVPALLTGGEYVMNRNAVSRLGVGFMHRLNRGEIPAFNTGGYVGEVIPAGNSQSTGVNDSISRLITSNERLRESMEKRPESQQGTQTSQPIVGSISIQVNIDKGGEVKADVKTQDTNNGKMGEDDVNQGRRIGDLIRTVVVETLVKESRNGGLLEQNFQKIRR